VIITNEDDALRSVRQAAREADTPAPVNRLSMVLNAVIPAVKKLADAYAEDAEMALYVGTAFCWFFGNRGSIRATIPDSQNASEMTFYKPADFGPITIARDSAKVSVRTGGVRFGCERTRSGDPVSIRTRRKRGTGASQGIARFRSSH